MKPIVKPVVFSLMASLATFVAVPANAAPAKILCQIKGAKQGDWISPSYVFQWQQGTNKAVVWDPAIAHFHGKPIAGKVLRDTEKKTVIDWVLKGAKDKSGNRAQFNFSMTHTKRNNRFKVIARPIGYKNEFGRNGTCAAVE